MKGGPASLFRQGVHSLAWVKDFSDQSSTGWGPIDDRIANGGPLLEAWQYVAKLVAAEHAGRAG